METTYYRDCLLNGGVGLAWSAGLGLVGKRPKSARVFSTPLSAILLISYEQ